jgi:hypothetical protein
MKNRLVLLKLLLCIKELMQLRVQSVKCFLYSAIVTGYVAEHNQNIRFSLRLHNQTQLMIWPLVIT